MRRSGVTPVIRADTEGGAASRCATNLSDLCVRERWFAGECQTAKLRCLPVRRNVEGGAREAAGAGEGEGGGGGGGRAGGGAGGAGGGGERGSPMKFCEGTARGGKREAFNRLAVQIGRFIALWPDRLRFGVFS